VSSTFNEIFVQEIYRPIKPLRYNCRIVDVGAHYGLFAIYAMLKLPASEILCVEPNPYSFDILRWNIGAANKHGVAISLVPFAIAAQEGPVKMYLSENCNTSLGSSILIPPGEPYLAVDVTAVTIAEAIRDHCDFLKLDAEGIEYDVLQNAIIIPSRVGEIAVEIHDISRQPDRFCAMFNTLLERGYSAFTTDGMAFTIDDVHEAKAGSKSKTMILHFV
jgi:FkbM family methyltransferase